MHGLQLSLTFGDSRSVGRWSRAEGLLATTTSPSLSFTSRISLGNRTISALN
jgi:hypothetical protein